MKVLYTVNKSDEYNGIVEALNNKDGWKVTKTDSRGDMFTHCSTEFYDVIVVDASIPDTPWKEIIKIVRDRQIFTPILVLINHDNQEGRLFGLSEGADMCIVSPIDIEEIVLCIRTLKRRNTNYQSPTINFEGVSLNRPDGKICYESTSLSVSPIEIEIFRLLVRATTQIHISKLADKLNESEDKVAFFANCLQKKIGLLNGPIYLEIRNTMYRLVKKNR